MHTINPARPTFSGFTNPSPRKNPLSVLFGDEPDSIEVRRRQLVDARQAAAIETADKTRRTALLKLGVAVAVLADKDFPPHSEDKEPYMLKGLDFIAKIAAVEGKQGDLRGFDIYGGGDYTFSIRETFPGKSIQSLDALCRTFQKEGLLTSFGADKDILDPKRPGKHYYYHPAELAVEACRRFLIQQKLEQTVDGISFQRFLGVALQKQQEQGVKTDGNTIESLTRTHRHWFDEWLHKGSVGRFFIKNSEPALPGIPVKEIAYTLACTPQTIQTMIQALERLPGGLVQTFRYNNDDLNVLVHPELLEDIDLKQWWNLS